MPSLFTALRFASGLAACLVVWATIVGIESTAAARPAAAPATTRSVARLLLAHYMPWYETPAASGKWGSHWTGPDGRHNPDTLKANGLPDLWSHFHPLIGPYDSSDPDVLECHLLQMKLAGIDGVIVDWYGLSDTYDYPAIHRGTKAMFAATAKVDMKFAVCFEDRTVESMVKTGALKPEQVRAHLAETFAWMKANWFDAPHYVRAGDRPLLLCFGPIYVNGDNKAIDADSAWRGAIDGVVPRPAFFALHHLWNKRFADGGFTWIHFDEFNDNPDQPDLIRARLAETHRRPSTNPAEVIPSVFPGFKDVYDQPHPRIDCREGETLRVTLDVALNGPWRIVQIATWNDYGEGTMIEPTHEFGYRFLEIIQAARREELGVDRVPFTPDDLRLPERLLAARRRGSASPAELGEIAAALSRGEAKAAREKLDAITR